MQFTDISEKDQRILLDTARDSIAYGLQHQTALPVDTEKYSTLLQTAAATFVTLNINNQLRGCIGTLEAYQPLINDVAEHAYNAAFRDSRFSALKEDELESLDIYISILTPSEPIAFTSEADLIRQLQPGIDGLILQNSAHRGTFLPSVWEQLPEPEIFLKQLKLKAGLNRDDWPEDIQVSRYKTVLIE